MTGSNGQNNQPSFGTLTKRLPTPKHFERLSDVLIFHPQTELLIDDVERKIIDPSGMKFKHRAKRIYRTLNKDHDLKIYHYLKSKEAITNWVVADDPDVWSHIDTYDISLCRGCLSYCFGSTASSKTHYEESPHCEQFQQDVVEADGTFFLKNTKGYFILSRLPDTGNVNDNNRIAEIRDKSMALMEQVARSLVKSKDTISSDDDGTDRESGDSVSSSKRPSAVDTTEENSHKKAKITNSQPDQPQSIVGKVTLSVKNENNLTPKQSKTTTVTNTPSINGNRSKSPKVTAEQIIDEMKESVKEHMEMMVDSIDLKYEEDANKKNPLISPLIVDYFNNPVTSTTILPFVLLDCITDDLWNTDEEISKSFRFLLSGDGPKLTLYNDKDLFPLSITLKNYTEEGWSVCVRLESTGNKLPDRAATFQHHDTVEAHGISFEQLSQALVTFRAVVYTVTERVSGKLPLPKREYMSSFIAECFENPRLDESKALKVVGERLFFHVARWKK